jgi:cell wall-associated NlpC family hydrolase
MGKIAAALLGIAALFVVLLPAAVLGEGAAASEGPGACAAGGTGQGAADVTLDAEQMANAAAIVQTTAAYEPGGSPLPSYAAVVAIATAYQESKLINSSQQVDHDSEGLFQQRVSFYTEAVAIDPVKSTEAFLQRLIGVADWQTIPLTQAAQTVQVSQTPAAYAAWQPMAEALVAQLWPLAASAASADPATPSVCGGGGGAIPPTGGGNNVAGVTQLPAGIAITGSAAGQVAAQFALAQLGKGYVFGAAGPDVWDCSGLTMGAWLAAGVALPHYTVTQAQAGTPTTIDAAVGGDLVFIPGSDGTAAAPGHVGMVIGTGPGGRKYVVQAPQTGVPVEVTDLAQWAGQVVAVRHIR